MFILSLLACVTAENFNAKQAGLWCVRAEECDKGSFEAAYDDQGECRDEFVSTSDDYIECFIENCDTFDAEQANQCLQALRTDSCAQMSEGDYLSDCDWTGVWSDCDDVDVALCIGAAL